MLRHWRHPKSGMRGIKIMESNIFLKQIMSWYLADLEQSYDCQVQRLEDLEQLFNLILYDVKRGGSYVR